MVLVLVALIIVEYFLVEEMAFTNNPSLLWFFIPILLLIVLIFNGFIIVQPNDSRVLILFGKYIGTVRTSGFWFVNPFTVRKRVSLRIRNFNSQKIKVNDLHGNPIEIGSVVVWRVVDTAKAIFDVENYEQFVDVQSETAIRQLASEYTYDVDQEDKPSLRGTPQK